MNVKTLLVIGLVTIFSLDAAIAQQLEQQTMSQGERPVQPDLPGDISIDFGFTMLNDAPDFLTTKFIPSRSLGLHYTYTFKLNDRITFNPAFGLGMDRIGIEDNVNFVKDTSNVYRLDTIQGLALRKNLMTFTYLELPLELRYYPFKTIAGEGFFIGAGGFVGVRVGSQTKIKYDFDEETRVERAKANLGFSDLRYGVQARIGFKNVSIFYKHYFNDLFQIEPAGADPRQFTFGINFTGF